MIKRDLVNEALRTTGVSQGVDSFHGVDPASDVGRVFVFADKARRDVSRKFPQAPLKKPGALNLVARVELASSGFIDVSGDGVVDNALVLHQNDSEVSGVADNPLLVDQAWNGRLFIVQGISTVYRVRDANYAAANFKLADHAGAEIGYIDSTPSTDSSGAAKSRAANWASTDTYPAAFIGQDRYALPADFKAPDNFNSFFEGYLDHLSPHDFDSKRYLEGERITWGKPKWCTIRSTTTSDGKPVFYVEVWPIPKVAEMIPFEYEASLDGEWLEDEDSGYQGEYEEAISSRLRWYIYRFVKKSETDFAVEDASWREVVADQKKNPITQVEQPRLAPVTHREHWGSAYDV